MVKVNAYQFFRVVELSEFIKVQTDIKEANLPALRSGFAGYPLNPRWNASKTIAWKTGRQWKLALNDGQMLVRTSDRMLVKTQGDRKGSDRTPTPEDPEPRLQQTNSLESLAQIVTATLSRTVKSVS